MASILIITDYESTATVAEIPDFDSTNDCTTITHIELAEAIEAKTGRYRRVIDEFIIKTVNEYDDDAKPSQPPILVVAPSWPRPLSQYTPLRPKVPPYLIWARLARPPPAVCFCFCWHQENGLSRITRQGSGRMPAMEAQAELTEPTADSNTLRLERLFAYLRKFNKEAAGKNLNAPLELTLRWKNGELQPVPVKVPEMIN